MSSFLARKPKLSYAEQVAHLKRKGITFNEYTEGQAVHYLQNNNNLFKLSSYRKNFEKDILQKRYLQLDFAYLVDLAIIDMYLRRIILQMALDIEHFAKVQIMRWITNDPDENGYSIVTDYLDSLDEDGRNYTLREIDRNKDSLYCQDLYAKYATEMPVWAFIEIISFGTFISFYKFCIERFYSKYNDSSCRIQGKKQKCRQLLKMKDNFFLMLSVKHIRNAAAHSNCILNDLKTKSPDVRKKANWRMSQNLSRIGIGYDTRINKVSNLRVLQILTCFFAYMQIVSSTGVIEKCACSLHSFSNRLYKRHSFKDNPIIRTTFDVIQLVIDKWFPVV